MVNQNPIIVGLDIGTTKIALIAGQKNANGKIEIIGFGKAKSTGVQHGQVLNIEKTVQAIQLAIADCLSKVPNLELRDVYVGIAGHHIKSLQTRGDMVRSNTEEEITQADIDKLLDDQYKTYVPAGDSIIEIVPQEFSVDNYQNIPTPPIGWPGIRIGANFHIITGDKVAIKNIKRSVNKANLETTDLVLQPLASASAVMCEQDFESGVLILDIGGGTSDIAIFHEGVLRHTAVIPFGGENITNDIKQGLGVLRLQAEQMKVQFGNALVEKCDPNAAITIPASHGMASKEISLRNLSHIIRCRVEEIFDFVSYHLKQAGLDKKLLTGGMIITGGGSQLKNIVELAELCTGLPARIGLPVAHLEKGYASELSKPMYSTCIGLILKGYRNYETGKFAETANYIKLDANNDFKLPDFTTTLTQSEVEQIKRDSTSVSNNIKSGNLENQEPKDSIENSAVDKQSLNKRKSSLGSFLDTIKTGIVSLFEDEDQKL